MILICATIIAMAGVTQTLSHVQKQSQKQVQKFSQVQIQGMSFLEMNSLDLRDEILKAASENPALKIVSDKFAHGGNSEASDKYQKALEATEAYGETLQEHLLHQLYSINLSEDEKELSEKLIYNLDENGFYGSNLAPEFLLNRSRPAQNVAMLNRCMDRIQKMDPVGTCCKNAEESLLVQAKLDDEAPVLALFLLDGHLEFLNPPEPVSILRKVEEFQTAWHKKAFASKLAIDDIDLNEDSVRDALGFIRTLNPRPALGYDTDSGSAYDQPDVVVTIKKVMGKTAQTDYSRGIVEGGKNYYFQVKYASGILPEVKVDGDALPVTSSKTEAAEYSQFRKDCIQKATDFVNNLLFRESTIILQACAVVNAQKAFFENGIGPLAALTRRQVAAELGINESSVSRTSNKKNSKFFQTEYGLFPASYFFTYGVSSQNGEGKVSSEAIKQEIKTILSQSGAAVSDAKLAQMLQDRGIKIARRTVAKYREQLGIKNSYTR